MDWDREASTPASSQPSPPYTATPLHGLIPGVCPLLQRHSSSLLTNQGTFSSLLHYAASPSHTPVHLPCRVPPIRPPLIHFSLRV